MCKPTKARSIKVRLLDDEQNHISGRCPRCMSQSGFRIINGKRGGWECLHCGVMFPRETWMFEAGEVKRRHKKQAKRRTYFDEAAWKGTAS